MSFLKAADLKTMDKRQGYQCTFVTGSMILTGGSILIGICFFSPYWLQNIGLHPEKEKYQNYIVVNGISGPNVTRYYPYRGLWAQCGAECIWFWSSNYTLQTQLFTPIAWHLATQVLYAVAGVSVLVSELYARVMMCCTQKNRVMLALGILVLVSALIQIASFAVFGGGAYQSYGVVSDPRIIVQNYTYLGSNYWNNSVTFGPNDYMIIIGWSFWIGVVGALMYIVAGVLFLITYCGIALACCPCCTD